MSDLISVIVPIYNVESYLDECLESIVNQTYSNLEIILVDDGSTDSCPQMCDEWAKKDTRIKVIHKVNGGLSSARNAGLDVCTGDYINFIDSDDYIEKEAYEILLKDMKENNVDMVMFSFFRILGKQRYVRQRKKTGRKYSSDEMLECFFYHRDGFCGSACDKLYKATLLKDIRFPEGLNHEDYLMLVELYYKTPYVYCNYVPLYNYRLRENSICTVKEMNAHTFDKIIISDKIRKYVEKNIPEKVFDAISFQAMARFEVYYDTVQMRHSKVDEKKWVADMKKFCSCVLRNKKLGIGFKIKYIIMSIHPSFYLKIKKIFVGGSSKN